MAFTTPAKLQPLHNFALPNLKWNKDAQTGSHHQRRRSIKSPSRRSGAPSASPVRQFPLREPVTATPPRYQSPLCESSAPPSPREFPVIGDYLGRPPFPVREWTRRTLIAPDPPLHFRRHDPAPDTRASGKDRPHSAEEKRFRLKDSKSDGAGSGVSLANPERIPQKFVTKSKAKEADETGINRSRKILIKIPFSKDTIDDEIPPEEPPKSDDKIETDETREMREEGKINCITDEETKIWNLRPRKPTRASLSENWDPARNNWSTMPENSKAQSQTRNPIDNDPKKGGAGAGAGGEKKVKTKLSVHLSLTKDEIAEDIFSLTGLKPARRPKKRARNAQRQVDALFPGAWLISITADSYKVSENFLKG